MKYILFFCCLLPAVLCAQRRDQLPNGHDPGQFPEHREPDEPRNKGNAILFHVSFGGHLPGKDMAERFGLNGAYGGGAEFLTASNFFIGVEGEGLFGAKVHDDPVAILRAPDGTIIGNDRAIASVALRERGLYFGGNLGKLFTFQEERKGIRVSLGAGWLQHRILVQDNRQVLTQITGEYRKGYDRLTGGLALNEFIGWQNLGKYRRANFMIGFEFNQGFTQTLRDWDFSEMRKLTGKRLDLRFGLKFAWTMPFYLTPGKDIYY